MPSEKRLNGFKPGEYKIFIVLLQGPRTYTELKAAAALSHPVLSHYLKRMQTSGLVIKDPETRKYQIPQFFTPNDEEQLSLSIVIATANTAIELITHTKKKEEKEKRLQKYFAYNLARISEILLGAIQGIAESVYKNKRRGNHTIEDAETFYYQLKGAIENWFFPWICIVATAYTNNPDVAEKVSREVRQMFFDMATKYRDMFASF